jgi:hypothetical protein
VRSDPVAHADVLDSELDEWVDESARKVPSPRWPRFTGLFSDRLLCAIQRVRDRAPYPILE